MEADCRFPTKWRAYLRQRLLAQPISVKGVREEHANADEDEECRHYLGHSFPPCVAMPERARLMNSR
jgi:hypothetical protein